MFCLLNSAKDNNQHCTINEQSTTIRPINENCNNSKNLTHLNTLCWSYGVYKQVSVSAAIFSNFCMLSRVFKTIFSFIDFITALSGEKLNIEKWPELGSGQK